jgi:serine/threonine-protein kinase
MVPQPDPHDLVSAGDLPTFVPERGTPASSASAIGRYVVERFHARGGLGEVYAATDTELNREVAFKRIQAPYADHPQSRRRFVREAALTARLDHPGVVPVFGLVSDSEGRPCYAMRFVHGETLSHQIAALHVAPQSAEHRDRAFRQLLQRFITVCNAIGFAHSKGVIHRDIKPANVMVGAFGEVQVMDWGLAKEYASAGHVSSGGGTAATIGVGTSGTVDRSPDGTEPEDETQAGTAVGTPAYMAPEQAAGDQVGPAADIYSLGATLYHLLTGRPAFPKTGELPAILAQVRRGEFPCPRLVAPRVPQALEAVCLKAMALRPEDRYPSALDLAADVERWLADEPVSCHHEPLRRRLARWGRRHRILVNSAGIAVLLAVAALGYTTVRVNQALARETVQKHKAEYRFTQAQQAVNDYLLRVADDPRLKADDLQPLRCSLLGDAQRYYADFLLERPDEPHLLASVAAAHLRLARTYQELGNTAAQDEYDLGISGYWALLAEKPDEPAWRIELARGYTNLGDFQMAGNGTRAEARGSYREALKLLEPLATDPTAWEALARTYTSLGRWHKGERSEEAAAFAQRAVEIHRQRWNRSSENLQTRQDLAQSLVDLATLHNEAHRLTAAKTAYEESLGHWRAVAASEAFGFAPKSAEGRILHDLGILYEQRFDPEHAAEARAKALAIRQATAYGHGLQQFTDLARTYNDYGLQKSGQSGANATEGRRLVAEGRRIREQLATLTNAPRELLMLAESHTNEANLAIPEKEYARAAESLKAGRAALSQLPPDHADTVEAHRALGLNHHIEGLLHVKQENMAKAGNSLAIALEIRSNLSKLNPDSLQDGTDLAATYIMLGNVALRSDAKAAIARYTEAGQVSRKLLQLSPENLSAQMMHSIIQYSLANASFRSGGKLEDVAERLTEAVVSAQSVRQTAPAHSQPQLVLGSAYSLLIQVRAKQGQVDAVGKVADAATDLFESEPRKLLELAQSLAVLVKTVPPGPDRDSIAEHYGAKAVRVLEQAAKAGFADVEPLRMDPFTALATRADFQALTQRMGRKDQ